MPFIRNSNFITPIHSYSCRHSAGEGFVSPSFTSSDYYRLCRAETYSYDSSDRLIQVDRNNSVYQTMEYDVNGNILSKTDVGTYNYDTDKRHAVTSIDVTDSKYRPGEQSVTYNFFGKVETIGEWDGDKYHELNITYGPDMERCKSVLTTNYEEKRTIIYSDSYECVTENGQTREFYYIGENVILVRQTGKSDIVCHAITDNQGSILCIVDDDGKRLFEAAYDAWGKQEKITNTIGFLRGYTGHEMLPEFGLINMNHLIKREQSELACYAERENGRMKFSGRVYDPALGRFLSPDNYVQMPDNTQSFNRYAYCVNNPLKYVDPSGELFGIDDIFIAFAAFNIASSMMQAAFNGGNIWKAGALSLLSSGASYGIGAAFGAAGTFGHEILRAGAHGLASGAISALDGGNFMKSFVSGAAASGIGSFAKGVNMDDGLKVASTTAMGGIASWAVGGDVMQGAMQGMRIGVLNHLLHDNDKILGRSARCEKLADGTFVAPFALDEVPVYGSTILSFNSDCPIERPLETVYPEFGIILLGQSVLGGAFKGLRSMVKYETGGLSQWIRIGSSYSKTGGFYTQSIRWGASPYYSEKIGNPILRQINQSLRNVKIPLNNWRTADKGHFHWKWGNKETEEWF